MTSFSHPDDSGSGEATARVAEREQPGAAGPATSQHWLRRPVLQGTLALVIYLAAWIPTAFWDVIRHASRATLFQQSMDPNFYVWCLRWWPYAIAHGLDPLYSHQIAAPAGHSLAWVTTVPPLALLAAPLTLGAGPVAAFNWLCAAALPISALVAFILCRRLTGKFFPALVGGAVFGFSAYEMNHVAAGQLNLTYSLLVPVLAYLVVVWWQGSISSRAFVILAALVMAVQFYLFEETFADLTAILVVALVVAFLLAGQEHRHAIVRLAKVTGIAYAAAIVAAIPYLAFSLTSKPPNPALVSTGMDLASLIVPRPGRTYGIGWLAQAAGRQAQASPASTACYIGIPLLLVVLLLAVTYWSNRLVRFLICMIAFIIVASLGPALHVDGHEVVRLPWASLWDLPILRNAYPARLMLFAFLALAVATALFLAGPARQLRWVKWPLAVLVALFVVLDAVPVSTLPHTSVPAFISNGTYLRKLTPGETVVVVSSVGNAGMLWQAQSGFYMRLAGGYINAGLNNRTDLPQQVQNLAAASPASVAAFERYVRTDRIGAVLVDMIHEPQWVGIFWRMGLRGHKIDHVIVYQLNGCRTCRALTSSELRS
jgi:hypothetical protein